MSLAESEFKIIITSEQPNNQIKDINIKTNYTLFQQSSCHNSSQNNKGFPQKSTLHQRKNIPNSPYFQQLQSRLYFIMNSKPANSNSTTLDLPASKTFIEKLKRLSKKFSSFGYGKSDIGQIIMRTFLDLPFVIDWFDLENTHLFYSLKTKMQFDLEVSDLVMIIFKYFLAKPGQQQLLAQKLIDKLMYNCQLLGFDIDNSESGSSQDSSTFLKKYKFQQSYKKQQKQENNKKMNQRSKSKPAARKKSNFVEIGPKKKVTKDQWPILQPPLEKKPKFQE